MKSRQDLVTELVSNPLIDEAAFNELRAYGWDCEIELVTLSMENVRAVLQQFRLGNLTTEQVYEWANRIELREDIGFEGGEESVAEEAMFWLANPVINWPLDLSLCDRIEKMFQIGHYEK